MPLTINELTDRLLHCSDGDDCLAVAARLLLKYQTAGVITATGELKHHDTDGMPLTADGKIARYGETYWVIKKEPVWEKGGVFPSRWETKYEERSLESCEPSDRYEGRYTTDPSCCYSTLEAAKAASSRKVGK
jgi:hypothetical protein